MIGKIIYNAYNSRLNLCCMCVFYFKLTFLLSVNSFPVYYNHQGYFFTRFQCPIASSLAGSESPCKDQYSNICMKKITWRITSCNLHPRITPQLFNLIIKQFLPRLCKHKLSSRNRNSTLSIVNWDYDTPVQNKIYKIKLKVISMTKLNLFLSLGPKNYDGSLNTIFRVELVPIANLEETLKTNNYSTLIWRNGFRNKDNFSSASAFVVDQDEGFTIEEAEKLLQDEGINYALITSRNHTEENHRFHIILPFNRKVLSLKNYETIANNIVNTLFPTSDPSVCDGGRFLFHSPDDAIYKSWFEGGNYNVD